MCETAFEKEKERRRGLSFLGEEPAGRSSLRCFYITALSWATPQ
ncbi:hypothetical protein HMPREF3214_00383 [Alloscardovia omnicolens]|nr:hypothetical protein HMPREF3214_00383 [Alloscardovia omnicolens]